MNQSSDKDLTVAGVALRFGIVALALGTAYIHSTLGGLLFTLNAIGYVQVQRAANITGPYTNLPGATNSPVTLPAVNAGGFFRTQWVTGQ